MIELRRIRDLAPGALDPLLATSAAEDFRFLTRLADEWRSGAERFDRPGALLLGVYRGAKLIAVGGLTPDPYEADAALGRLRHLYVHPEARGQGVGRLLVAALEAEARNHYSALTLRTDTERAARFYESIGYTRLAAGGTATHRRALR
jgi:GNAT superfamily N-acetyltransferase